MAAQGTGSAQRQCNSCGGTGEVGTEVGVVDCPDCGGSGVLAHPNVLVEWRARDIEKARAAGSDSAASDFRWLIAELRRARTALTEIASLAEDMGESEVAKRIRVTAGEALALYDVEPLSRPSS
jgi:predicted  nucleic acid-binding Zn-ribbon protein